MGKILIIKLGYSETLDKRLSTTTSLGDVLRTTFLLHYFKNDEVYWLADKKVLPLLERNIYIKKIFVYNKKVQTELEKDSFEAVLNFEKSPSICKLSDSLKANFRFGFNGVFENVENYFGGDKRLVRLSADVNARRKNKDCWQKILAEAVGKTWRGEKYILGYKPKSKIKYDIGFNWTTSSKWKNKSWPKVYWQELYKLLKGKYSVSWQKGLKNLYEYIDWINSCRLIVTADTLGLHISIALRKRIIALFGPTSHSEIYLYGCGNAMLPEVSYKCIPCLKQVCHMKKPCMEFIFPEKVKTRIDDEF